VARLESLLDPDPADPWPRHLDHFGASLACTPEIYRLSGGLPCVTPLEDVAFVDAMRRCDARIRHSVRVRVQTSARFDGRAHIGFSGQLNEWQRDARRGQSQLVESCSWLEHRFRSMRGLRLLHAADSLPSLAGYPEEWRSHIQSTKERDLRPAAFLQEVDCNGLIEAMFSGDRYCPIAAALADLDVAIQRHEALCAATESDTALQGQLQLQS
jgi:hypothetical protein